MSTSRLEMELTKERAKENLAKLIEKFNRELSAGRIKEYNEEATKTSFIQPLLKDVLGWDVNDRNEVSPEEKISRGRVDYGVKVEGKTKFYIEAKPPKADLSKHIEQAVRYGYNRKGVPFVLLTDFEGLKLFDVTVKPDVRNPLKGLKIDLDWDHYLPQFETLWLLSKESIIQGELDRLLLVKPKERLPVDKAILDDLQRWRETLAKDIFKNNPKLFHSRDREKDATYLKEITQRILDRIIFMRSCEDRGLIHRRPLKELFEERTETVGTNTMIFLKEEFKHYNIIFDSDLFRPQEWENNLAIDFKVMRSIVLETYNPYQFDVIPLEVLGNIYEQYLGYTIRLTEHQVKYELKPEVRKAGGVYYTPEYIVDYIVKNTVGKLLQELPPGKIKKLRILDPACGSGSFLIRAYEEMLSYYRNQKKQKKKTVEDQEKLDLKQEETASHLTIQEKSEVLREHIFGVDIDEQAVEVTKLSLMLKMLGDEYGIIPGRAILPMLDRNIKCGNSLISGNTLELKEYFGEEWYKVKPFNWDEEFRKIMKEEGGFDVVIGNPPYVFGRDWKMLNISDAVKKYLGSTYKTSIYQLDMFSIFMERGFQLCRMSGVIGQIVPNVWLTNIYSSTLRKFILSHAKELCILTPPPNVFPGITVDTIVYTFQKASKSDKFFNIKSMRNGDVIEITTLTTEEYLNGQRPISTVINQDSINLVYRLKENYPELQMFTKITRGVHPYRIGGYGLSAFETGPQTERDIQERPYNSSFMREGYRPFIYGRDLSRFKPLKPTEFIKYGPWLAEPRDPEFFEGKRIYSRKILGERLIVTIETTNSIADQQVYITKPLIDAPNVSYLAGILGSKLIAFFIRIFYNELNDSFPQIKVGQLKLKSLPIRTINFSDQSERKLHDDLVALVDVMLDLNKKIQTAKGNEKEQIQRQIDQTDREIDEIVYELYGITEEERRIIEGKE